MRYKFFNLSTNHVFLETDNLKEAITFYHKVPRRKNSNLVILDTETGEVVKNKLSRQYLLKPNY